MMLVPSSFPLPPQGPVALPGQVQVLFITLSTDDYGWVLDKITRWFADRPEVRLVDHGLSDKVGLGCLILEWHGRDVDPLFHAILREEALVADYCVYTRGL